MSKPTPTQRVMAKLKAMGIHGAGDAVAVVAQPIARVIDSVAGTNIQGCKGCESRKQSLNQKFPIDLSN